MAAMGDHNDFESSWEEGFSYSGHPSDPSRPRFSFCKFVKILLSLAFLGFLAFVFLKWVGPFSMDKGIIPIINWVRSTFTPLVLAYILFTTVAIFPTIILPSTPSMWVAGMTFGYGYGFLLIMPAMSIGVSLPYFIGSLFHHKVQGWLQRYPKNAALIRLAGEGEWIDQFRAVALIRVSPFSLHRIQLLRCCNQCKIWTLHLRLDVGSDTRSFRGNLHWYIDKDIGRCIRHTSLTFCTGNYSKRSGIIDNSGHHDHLHHVCPKKAQGHAP